MKNSIKLIAAGLLFSTALIAPAVSHAAVGDDNNELDSKGQITFTPNTCLLYTSPSPRDA